MAPRSDFLGRGFGVPFGLEPADSVPPMVNTSFLLTRLRKNDLGESGDMDNVGEAQAPGKKLGGSRASCNESGESQGAERGSKCRVTII